jgi:hypothetical protein
MPNFFAVNKASNLIVKIISSSFTPTANSEWAFYPASDKALDTYYKWLTRHDTMPDIGYMIDRHPYLR